MNTLVLEFALARVELMMASSTSSQSTPATVRARPSQGTPLADDAKPRKIPGPNATSAA